MKQRFTIDSLFLFFLALLLFVFTFAVPPLQKPDEEVHFYRALSVASGHFYCPKPAANYLTLDGKSVYFINAIHRLKLPLYKNNKFDIAVYQKILTDNYRAPSAQQYSIDYQCNYPLISFIPQALGIAIGNLITANILVIFFLGRLALAIVAFVWMVILYRKINPKLQPLLLVLYFTPVLLQQVTSYSYDGIHILLALTIFVLIVNRTKSVFGLFITTLLLLLAKPSGYELFALTVLSLPLATVAKNKKEYVLRLCVFFGSLLLCYGLAKVTLLSSYSAGERLRVDVSPITNTTFILHNPLYFITLLFRTSFTRLVFYIESTIGILGWLEYSIGTTGYIAYGLLAGYILFTTQLDNFKTYTKLNIIIIEGIVLGTYVVLSMFFYILWTLPQSANIEGVQGRYFLPLLPLTYLLFVFLRQTVFPNNPYTYKKQIAILLTLLVTLTTIIAVFVRYY